MQKFGKNVVQRYGWEWFACKQKEKYMGDEIVNKVRLQSQFPIIYQTVIELGLRFIFDNPGDCNLTLGERCQVFFPNSDPDEFNNLKDKSPYRDIRYTMCGVDSTARVWLKIVCNVLFPAKHLTKVTRYRVILVYMMMKGIPINVGAILR
ncbi:hypothetical protein H5410_061699 [Solanum commersonii]|uniref:Uncharacterized protein n=1 Tax=Solanum commersonii TaxID=4109 RepID=A0A9J5W8L3_SOLCO|nr:hypothetical protein H5410_061699 [Solanum commersonii]